MYRASSVGSSPHTRGAPSYTGQPYTRSLDHPRIRGEHAVAFDTGDAWFGSSPHTRGARVRCRISRSGPGIIPAYAGSTGSCRPARPCREDHPRIRGEHQRPQVFHEGFGGSSPHTRGAREWSPQIGRRARIIPAYAGSTAPVGEHGAGIQDHPRIRGEHLVFLADGRTKGGSSPHTRGALLLIYSIYICIVDHPRIRGEHVKLPPIHLRSGGSSPHTRGAQPRRGRLGAGPGIIPAYAGSTWRLRR